MTSGTLFREWLAGGADISGTWNAATTIYVPLQFGAEILDLHYRLALQYHEVKIKVVYNAFDTMNL